LSIDAPGNRMSNTPESLLVALPTTLPASSSTLILTPGTAAGGFSRASLRHPWMWIVSSLRGAGFWQVCEPASGTGAADADPLPVITSMETVTPSSTAIHAEMLLGRACMGLLSPLFGSGEAGL
jgi:hypothetical protein